MNSLSLLFSYLFSYLYLYFLLLLRLQFFFVRKLEYNFANKNVWLQANLLISIYLDYNIVILTWSVIASPLYLSNLWSQQINLFPTINILKCWRPRDKIGEHAHPSVKIRIARNTKTRRLLFCIQCIECVSYFNFRCHKFVGVSEEADMAKKRTSRKVKKNKSLLIFYLRSPP